ncbi:hypothetical protein NQ314_004460 [Rhamnusium bicolor]|uniref:Uncharacterized protein n=1 Tax=Rhamnusium bicolor TaxID=1586634 RepID=A0AAV8ZLG3_9CUCU|nr:hypothetical protein NQ314_004460 [Rhamnusium bicolor]
MKSELSPEAPTYVPPPLRNVTNTKFPSSTKSTPTSKEPQCSRYSRRSVRQVCSAPNSPRPILGTRIPFPRPILGRKSEGEQDEVEEYIGKEFRSMTRSFSKLKIKDDAGSPSNKTETCC